MIYYDGTKVKDNVNYIRFKNEMNVSVEIPLDEKVLNQILIYLNKIQPSKPKMIERGNDELSE